MKIDLGKYKVWLTRLTIYIVPRVETIYPKQEKIATPIPPKVKTLGILGEFLSKMNSNNCHKIKLN